MPEPPAGSPSWHAWRFPHHETCFLCGEPGPGSLGLRIETIAGAARTNWLVEAREQGPKGWGHGGMIAAVLDELMAYAIIPFWPGHVTKEFSIRFLLPTAVGMTLHCTAECEKLERHINAIGRVYLPDGRLAAEASATWVQPRGPVVVDHT